ncbi:MAG: PilZ domain-containing protein [Gammaproteobacteria bacterium]|nr:PilZ domain-containing protein [Gammaproteobacteria bacterium]
MAKAQSRFHERRYFARRMVNARVKLVHGSIGEVRAKTRDVSDSGVFVVVTPVPKLPVGSHIKMHMLDSRQPDIAFNMKVVRTTPEGVGMMFIDYEIAGQRFPMDVLRKQLKK